MKTTITLSALLVWYLFCLLPARGDCVFNITAFQPLDIEVVQLLPTVQLRTEYCSDEILGPVDVFGNRNSDQITMSWLWSKDSLFDAAIQQNGTPVGSPDSVVTTPIGDGMSESIATFNLPPGDYFAGTITGVDYGYYDASGEFFAAGGITTGVHEVSITVVPEPNAFVMAFVAFALAWGYQSWRESRHAFDAKH